MLILKTLVVPTANLKGWEKNAPTDANVQILWTKKIAVWNNHTCSYRTYATVSDLKKDFECVKVITAIGSEKFDKAFAKLMQLNNMSKEEQVKVFLPSNGNDYQKSVNHKALEEETNPKTLPTPTQREYVGEL